MPVLSFPCVIHRLENRPRPANRRVWVKGHDFRTLAFAATAQLGATPDRCEYTLVSPGVGPPSAFLEVTHANGDALLGPMASPLPTPALRDRRLSLKALIEALGLEEPSGGLADRDCEPDRGSRYQVIVTYTPICERDPFPPVRQERETDAQYKQRFDAAERTRIERARQQGMHVVFYDVPPKDWTAPDLEMLMVLAYQRLPTNEPRWRESGTITQAKFVNPHERHRVTLAYCLQVGRGDFVAHLRLPAFPKLAIADWLESRHFELNLRHPVMRTELVSRGWRCVERLSAAKQPQRRTNDTLTGSLTVR